MSQQASQATSDTIKEQKAEIEKLNKLLLEAAEKMVQATEHMKEQIKTAQEEAESARVAEAEIREAMSKSQADQEKITLLATKVTTKLKEANEKIVLLQSSPVQQAPIELSNLQKLNIAFEAAMNVSAKSKTSQAPLIVIDDDGDEHEGSSTSSQSTRFKIKIDSNLSSFTGRPEENVSDWLYTLKRELDSGNYYSKEKLMIATNYLKDIALQDYMLRERMYGKDTWVGFCEYMTEKYTPANQNILIRERLKMLKQTTSVENYYIDFRKLALQSTSMTDEERMSLFLANLKPSLSKYCFLQDCTTLDQCYSTALKKELYSDDSCSASIYYSKQSSGIKFTKRSHLAKDCLAKTQLASKFNNKETKDDLIKWHAKINHVKNVEVVLDSGGTRSVMSLKFAQSIGLNINRTNYMVESSTGDLSQAFGVTDSLEVNFESIISNISFLVTNLKSVDILLGNDWFDQSGVLLDPRNRTFMLPNRKWNRRKSKQYAQITNSSSPETATIFSINFIKTRNYRKVKYKTNAKQIIINNTISSAKRPISS